LWPLPSKKHNHRFSQPLSFSIFRSSALLRSWQVYFSTLIFVLLPLKFISEGIFAGGRGLVDNAHQPQLDTQRLLTLTARSSRPLCSCPMTINSPCSFPTFQNFGASDFIRELFPSLPHSRRRDLERSRFLQISPFPPNSAPSSFDLCRSLGSRGSRFLS